MRRTVLLLVALAAVAMAKPTYPNPYCSANSSVNPWLPSAERAHKMRASGWELAFVQIVFRHGDRTPVVGFPGDETLWLCNLDSLDDVGSGTDDRVSMDGEIFRQLQLYGRNVLNGNCSLGQLTTIGHKQHNVIGSNFRELYVDELEFLPASYTPGTVWARNNNIPRCYQSMQSELQGLYPSHTRGHHEVAIPIFTMDPVNENMSPNYGNCPALNALVASQQQSAAWLAFEAANAELTAQLLSALDLSSTSEVASTQYPFYIDVFDQIMTRNCHGLPQPAGIDQSVFEASVAAGVWAANNWLYNISAAKLSIGSFLNELVSAMETVVAGEPSPLLRMYAGQDLTIAPLLNTMGVYNGVWPAYASHISIELWSQGGAQWAVRLLYDGQELTMPGCGGNAFCPWASYLTLVEPSTLTPAEYAEVCGATSFQGRPWPR